MPGSVTEMPLVVSVTVTSPKTTVIGGLHLGWKVAVRVSEKFALPFWTGKSPAALNVCCSPRTGSSGQG